MKAAVLFSGGKDSAMATYKAIKGGWKVEYLVSMISRNPESYMFHTSNIHLTELAAEAMDIPLIHAHTPGIKEKELNDLKNVLSHLKDKGVDQDSFLVAVCPGSGDSWQETAYYKRWPKENFITLCRKLQQKPKVKIILYLPPPV